MAFILVGITFLVIISVSSLFMFSCPDGFVPEGWKAPENRRADKRKDKDWKEMLKSPIFYLMILLFDERGFQRHDDHFSGFCSGNGNDRSFSVAAARDRSVCIGVI